MMQPTEEDHAHLNTPDGLAAQVMRQKVEEEGSQSLLEPVTGPMICDAIARQMQVLGFLLCAASSMFRWVF